jgi:hypothetical protein
MFLVRGTPGDRDRRQTTDDRRPTTDDRRSEVSARAADKEHCKNGLRHEALRPFLKCSLSAPPQATATDDRRPTTDDRRPTTDDRRPTTATDDRRRLV